MVILNASKVWFKLHSVICAAVFAVFGIAWLLLAPVRGLIPLGGAMSVMVFGCFAYVFFRLRAQPQLQADMQALGTSAIQVSTDIYNGSKEEVQSFLKKSALATDPSSPPRI